MRFIINNLVKYTSFIEAAKREAAQKTYKEERKQAFQNVLRAAQSDFANMRKTIGKTANRTAPLVANANIYLSAFELANFARSQNDAQTAHFCQVTMFGALRLIEERLAQELGRETLTKEEDFAVSCLLELLLDWANEEANDAYQSALF